MADGSGHKISNHNFQTCIDGNESEDSVVVLCLYMYNICIAEERSSELQVQTVQKPFSGENFCLSLSDTFVTILPCWLVAINVYVNVVDIADTAIADTAIDDAVIDDTAIDDAFIDNTANNLESAQSHSLFDEGE